MYVERKDLQNETALKKLRRKENKTKFKDKGTSNIPMVESKRKTQ